MARCENNIPATMQEMREFFEQEAGKDKGNNEAQLARRKRGFMERINRDKDLCVQFKMQIEVLEQSLRQEGGAVIAEIANALSKDYGDVSQQCDELKKEIARLQYQVYQLQEEFIKQDIEKERRRGICLNFQKQWTPERVIELLTDPTNEKFHGAGIVVEKCPMVLSDWEKAVSKRMGSGCPQVLHFPRICGTKTSH